MLVFLFTFILVHHQVFEYICHLNHVNIVVFAFLRLNLEAQIISAAYSWSLRTEAKIFRQGLFVHSVSPASRDM